MRRIYMYIATALLISGCGNNGESSFSDGITTSTIEAGSEVFVSSGDSITPDNEDTEIIVSHYLNNTKSVEVIKGSVTLLSGNYNAN